MRAGIHFTVLIRWIPAHAFGVSGMTKKNRYKSTLYLPQFPPFLLRRGTIRRLLHTFRCRADNFGEFGEKLPRELFGRAINQAGAELRDLAAHFRLDGIVEDGLLPIRFQPHIGAALGMTRHPAFSRAGNCIAVGRINIRERHLAGKRGFDGADFQRHLGSKIILPHALHAFTTGDAGFEHLGIIQRREHHIARSGDTLAILHVHGCFSPFVFYIKRGVAHAVKGGCDNIALPFSSVFFIVMQNHKGGNMTAIAFPMPSADILARRDFILAGLAPLLPAGSLVTTEDERRAFETDAFTAYRRVPLAVALPTNTAEVSAVLAFCHQNGVPVVPRGAGTSLAGGAIPQEDAVVIGLSKMNRILEIDYPNRLARVEAGVTNLAITNTVSAEGFFYAPDPSSQLACTIGGNIGMNSGGAHCLKYGVTTNNILGVTMVLVDGTVIEVGGAAMDAPGYDLLGLICGSEGQLGIITEATVRILRSAEGARPVLFGFETSGDAGAAVAAIIGAGIVPVAMEFMDKPAIEICEAFAHAGYPMDVEALLIIEVEGSELEMETTLARIVEIAKRHNVKRIKESKSAMETAAIWKGRKSAFGATGRIADYICMDGTIPTGQLPFVLKRIDEIVKHYGLRVANVFHAGDGNLHPLILYNVNDPAEAAKAEEAGNDILKLCVEVGGCLTGEHGVGIEKRDLMRHQFNEPDLHQQMHIRAAFDAGWLMNPAKVFPLDGRAA